MLQFNPTPFRATYVRRITLTRTGGYRPNWIGGPRGLWIFADASDIDAHVVVRDVDILESMYQEPSSAFKGDPATVRA
jgi:hypothetical protein